jgi:hypothetical protein
VIAASPAAGQPHRRPARRRSIITSKASRAAGNAHHMTALKWPVSWNMRFGAQA